MNKILLGLMLVISVHSAPASAVECADGVRLDQIESITLTLKSPLTDVHGSAFDDSEKNIVFVNGSFVNSRFLDFAQSAYQRRVDISIRNQYVNQATVQPFSCESYSIVQGNRESRSSIYFYQDCPIKQIIISRAAYDFRASKITLASLRYNLGKQFIVHAQCEQ